MTIPDFFLPEDSGTPVQSPECFGVSSQNRTEIAPSVKSSMRTAVSKSGRRAPVERRSMYGRDLLSLVATSSLDTSCSHIHLAREFIVPGGRPRARRFSPWLAHIVGKVRWPTKIDRRPAVAISRDKRLRVRQAHLDACFLYRLVRARAVAATTWIAKSRRLNPLGLKRSRICARSPRVLRTMPIANSPWSTEWR